MQQQHNSQRIPTGRDQSEGEVEELSGLGQEPVERVSSQILTLLNSTHHRNWYRIGESKTNTSTTDDSVICQFTPQGDKTNDNLNNHDGEDEVQWDLELLVDLLEAMGPWECPVLCHTPT